MAKRVVVTGVGPLSSLGSGQEETWDNILKLRTNIVKNTYDIDGERWGEFYLHKIKAFNINDFDIPKENFRFIKELRTVKKEDTDLYYFLAVISLALKDSALEYDENNNEIGLMITNENPGVEIFFEELIDVAYELFIKYSGKRMTKLELAQGLYNNGCEERGYNLQTFSYLFAVAKVFGFHGYSLFINNACASGLFAMESAARQIKSGISPVVVVAAVDNPNKIYKYLWFKKKNLYSENGITRPFSKDSSGVVFGDGGAAIVLEDLDHAKKRKAKIYGEYLGGGFSLEGWKITVPDITNDSYIRSFNKAISASGIKPSEIDFVNPHGVGLRITDTYEANTINAVFKKDRPLVSAFKPLLGHNLGGSSLLESIISLMALSKNIIPTTLNCENFDENFKIAIVRENMKKTVKIIAKMSCGFAGFSGVVIFKKLA